MTKAALDATTLADAIAAETDLEVGLERYDDHRRRPDLSWRNQIGNSKPSSAKTLPRFPT